MPSPRRSARPSRPAHVLTRSALRLALDQRGVLRREQLLSLGVTHRTITEWIASGTLVAESRRVLRLPGVADDYLRACLIAGHHVHPRGALTGPSAAAVAGILARPPWDALSPPLRVWVRHPSHLHCDFIVVRRPPQTPRPISAVAVEDQEVALGDALRRLPAEQARDLAHRIAFDRGAVAGTALVQQSLEAEPKGRGGAQLRSLLAALNSGAWAESEERLLELVRGAGFTGFHLNYRVFVDGRVYYLDLAFPEVMVAFEVDGREHHSSEPRRQGDMHRVNALQAAGWDIRRFSWTDVTGRPEYVLHQIAQAVGEAD